jgi:hypothetical protein
LHEVWEGISEPLIPAARKGSAAETIKNFAESGPDTFSEHHPYVGASLRGLAGAVSDTAETLRSMTSPLMIGTLELGELGKGAGAIPKVARAGSRLLGVGFGAQGLDTALEGLHEGNISKTLNGLGQALLSTAAEMRGTKVGNAKVPFTGEKVPGEKTVLRPTTQTTAGVEAPISAAQQENPSLLTRAMKHVTTPGVAEEFQREQTKPAAKKQMISALSQVATDKIAAHEAIVNGEAAPEEITGTQTPGEHITPDEIWPAMQESAGQTWQKARDVSATELDRWKQEKAQAEQTHKAGIDHYNDLVQQHNADPANADNQMEPHQFDPADADVREKPKTYDELKADVDAARDRLGRNNPTDVREKAKLQDVPKAEKAMDAWFKEHEDVVSPTEYDSAKKLWADSERFKEIATNLRGKIVKGTLTGNDIRGLEAVVDNKAIARRGQAGIGEFDRLVGPEAKANLEKVAKLFDPLDKGDPRAAGIKSWGYEVARHAVSTMLAPILGLPYLGVEAANAGFEWMMNRVMFDPEFGSSFANFVEATKTAIQNGIKVPAAIVNKFKDDFLSRYKASKMSDETGAVSLGGVKRAKVGPQPTDSPNASGESAASQEAINRTASEKGQGVKRVVVDTRSGVERPLMSGVDAVDYQAKPYESVEFRGGDRDGEVIDRGNKARPYQRKELFTTATRTNANASPLAAENEVASVANEYNKTQGRPAMDTAKVNVDPRGQQIADAFDAMKHNPNDPKVKASYSALVDELKAQKAALEAKGYTFSLSDKDPYSSYEEMRDDVKNNKHITVWTGGNELAEGHPLAKKFEGGWDGNTLLRGVHDVMGHVAGDNDFSEKGEENAYNLHKQTFSKDALPALTTETKGQTSWFFNNKGVRGGEPLGKFADQKAGLLPEQFHTATSPVIDHIKANKPFAVLTAENPQNTRISDAANQKLNEQMVAELKQEGYHPVAVEGHNSDVEGKKENSFFVPDITPEDAARFGRKYKQTAILTQEGLHDLNKDTVNPSDNGKVMTGKEAAKQPYYSSVNGTPFSVPLDFDKEVPARKDNSASEITTRRPKSVSGDRGNNPGQHADMGAIEQADRNNPSGKTALGKTKMGYKEKLARTVANYTGVNYTPEDLANPDKVLSKFVNHAAGNLEWLYNQVPEEIRSRTRQWYDAANKIVAAKAKSYGFTPEQGAGVTAALSPQNPWDNNLGLANRTMDIFKNRQNQPFSPEMEQKAAELKKVPTQSKAFKGLLKDIAGKKLKDVKNADPDVQAVQRALWIRLYDEAHGNPVNDQYAPTGEVVGHSPDTRSWIGLDHVSKAVKILEDGSVTNINDVMGQGHKIRNFYNNIINPNSKAGHITIDTHATAAAQLQPFGAKDTEAVHNFGGTTPGTPGAPKNAATGLQGTYPLYAEAYQRVARKLGILPRELQSVTWEGVKSLMGDEKKTPELKKEVKQIWQDVQDGKLTAAEARGKIKNASNGFSKPAWMSDEEWEKLGPEGEDTSFEGGK